MKNSSSMTQPRGEHHPPHRHHGQVVLERPPAPPAPPAPLAPSLAADRERARKSHPASGADEVRRVLENAAGNGGIAALRALLDRDTVGAIDPSSFFFGGFFLTWTSASTPR